MHPISKKDDYLAYFRWFQNYPAKEADIEIRPFLNCPTLKEGQSWIRMVRKARLLSTGALGEKLNMTRAGISDLEKREIQGKTTLETLIKVAEVMDCDLVYALRPKKRIPFSHAIWKELLKESMDHSWIRTRLPHAKSRALSAVTKRNFSKGSLRRSKGWTERR